MKTLLKNLWYFCREDIKGELMYLTNSCFTNGTDLAILHDEFHDSKNRRKVKSKRQDEDVYTTVEWKLPNSELGLPVTEREKTQSELLHELRTTSYVVDMNVRDFFRTDRVSVLTSRAIYLAGCNGIETVSQLTNWTAKELLKTENIGIKTVGYIQHMLAKYGLKLKEYL